MGAGSCEGRPKLKSGVIVRNRTRGRESWGGMNRWACKGAASFQPPTTGCAGGAPMGGQAGCAVCAHRDVERLRKCRRFMGRGADGSETLWVLPAAGGQKPEAFALLRPAFAHTRQTGLLIRQRGAGKPHSFAPRPHGWRVQIPPQKAKPPGSLRNPAVVRCSRIAS